MTKRIVYIQYANPAAYPPVEHSSRILADDGWKVLFLGTVSQGTEALELGPHGNIEVRCLRSNHTGWRLKLHYLGFWLWVLAWTLRWRPRWIYASDPLSCPIALMLSYWPGLQVLYHEHDAPAPNRGARISRFQWWALWARNRLVQRAALCALPNEKRVETFQQETNTKRPVLCVWNCPAQLEAEFPRPTAEGEHFLFFFHGSIVPVRLPVTVLDALAKLPPHVRFRVAGYETLGHIGYVDVLRERARALGIALRVEFVGSLPRREQLLRECRKASVGLAFMPTRSQDPNHITMTRASNKPFDYMACGLALLVSDLPDWRSMFVEPGYGLACDPDDPESIAQVLRWFVEHPEETWRMGERGRERIREEWNYERQFGPVLARLRRSNHAER